MDATATDEITGPSNVTLSTEEGANSEDVEIHHEAPVTPFPLGTETAVKLELVESLQSTSQCVASLESEITQSQQDPEVVSTECKAGTLDTMDIQTENIDEENPPLDNVKIAEIPESNESPPVKRKKTARESLVSRMMKKTKVIVTTVTTRHYRCRICFISMSCPSELAAHVKLVHNLRFEGSPIVQPCEEPEDESDGLSAAMRNLSNILEECELMGQYTEDEKLHLEKVTSKGKKSVDKYFRCRLCFIDFKFKEELSHHMTLHAQNKVISCKNCGMFFSTQYTLKKHAQKDSDEETIHKCTENKCYSGFSNRKCFLFHLTTHDGLHRCPTCEKTYEFSDEVLQHITDMHILNKIDPSTASDRSEGEVVEKKGNKKVAGKQGKVPCDQCGGKLFSNIARHLRDCHYKFKCPVCRKGSSSQVNLNQHLSRMHPNYVIPKNVLDPKRPFQCDLCSKTYTHLCYLSRHYNLDHGNKQKMRLAAESESEPETADEAVEPVETEPEQDDEDLQTSSEDENKKKTEFPHIPRDEFGRYKCPTCGPDSDKSFATKDSVYRHLRRIHKQLSLAYKRPTPDQTDTDEEDDQKTKVRCVLCRYRLANSWSLGRHAKNFHPNYPNPDSPAKRRGPKPKVIPKRIKRKAKVSSEEEVDEESSESQEDDEPLIPVAIEEPVLEELVESPESELDEDKYETLAPPESEKSDISSDDDDVDPDPSIIDSGVNKPPYRCQQCPGKYTQMWNLNRHERLHHRYMTVFDEDKNRILVLHNGPTTYGSKRRRGGRRGRGGYLGGSGIPRKRMAGRPSVDGSVGVNSSEGVVKTEVDPSISNQVNVGSFEHAEASESSKVPSASKDATSTPAGPRRLTRSSRSLEPTFPQLDKSDSSEESDSDIEDDTPFKQKQCQLSLKCPKLRNNMNIVIRHLRADHLMDELSIVIFSMLFGYYRCPFCRRPFNFPKDLETRDAQLREHIASKHPSEQFPSPEEIQKRKDEMKEEMAEEDDLRSVSKSHKRLGSSLPVVKVMKMDIDQETRAIDGNSQILSISPDKLTESMVGDSCTTSSDNLLKQNPPQNTGEISGGELNDFVESSDGCPQVPSDLTVETIDTGDTAGQEIDVKPNVEISESGGQNVKLEPELSKSKEEVEEVVQNSELNSDSDLPVFSNSVIYHVHSDFHSESVQQATEEGEQEELNQPTTLMTDLIKEEPCSSVTEADTVDTDIRSSEDLLSLPEPEPLTEKKPMVFNVTIPQIKLSSSTERRSSAPGTPQPPASPVGTTNDQENARKRGKDDSLEDIVIIEEVKKEVGNEEKPGHKKKPCAIQPPPIKLEPRDLGRPTEVPKPLPVTADKPGTSKSFETKRIHPERMMIIEQPTVSSSHTTPTPVVVRRLSDLIRPGDPKIPAVVSIQPKTISGFPSAQRVRLISHQSFFRCSVCNQVFQSKKDMLTHVSKTHTLQALHSATSESHGPN